MGKLAKETHGQCNCQMLAKGGAVKSNPFMAAMALKDGSKKSKKQMKKGGKCK